MDDLIEPHDPIPDCDCRNCACRERDRLRKVLQRIAEHHEAQRDAWGDVEQEQYHEERRDFALFHLTPNVLGNRLAAGSATKKGEIE